MTDADDILEGGDLDLDATEGVLAQLLAGHDPGPEEPAWAHGVAVLVRAARAPARADELAGEADIVARMAETRQVAVAERPSTVASEQLERPQPPELVVGAGRCSDARPGNAVHLSDHDGTGRSLAGVVRLGDRRAAGRHYRAKHAAARLEASRNPAVRTVGRVMAMNAAAATTAAVIGMAAAAAATTGLVATVVVPALSEEEPPAPDPAPAVTERSPRIGTTADAGSPADIDEQTPVLCSMIPACMSATATTAAPGPAPPTTVPAPSPATTAEDVEENEPIAEATTTTTVPSSTTTTASTTSTTTTTAPPPVTVSVPEPPDGGGPGPGPAPLAADPARAGTP